MWICRSAQNIIVNLTLLIIVNLNSEIVTLPGFISSISTYLNEPWSGSRETVGSWTEMTRCPTWWGPASTEVTGSSTGWSTRAESGPKSAKFMGVEELQQWELMCTSSISNRTLFFRLVKSVTVILIKSTQILSTLKSMLSLSGWRDIPIRMTRSQDSSL